MILRHRTGPAFQAIKDGLAVGLNALTLTDITKNATYGVEMEGIVKLTGSVSGSSETPA